MRKAQIKLDVNAKRDRHNDTVDLATLLDPIKIALYKGFTEQLEGDFEPTEFLDLLFKLLLIAYPHQEELSKQVQAEALLIHFRDQPRPAAIKSFLKALNLNDRQHHRLLEWALILLKSAEEQEKGFVFCRIYIETELSRLKQNGRENQTTEKVRQIRGPLKLSDIFRDQDELTQVINLLIQQEYCHPVTLRWMDEKKGNKGFLIAILKALFFAGYYKKDLRPTNEDFRQIAFNTFSQEISIDTIKRSGPTNYDVSFIPRVSSGK